MRRDDARTAKSLRDEVVRLRITLRESEDECKMLRAVLETRADLKDQSAARVMLARNSFDDDDDDDGVGDGDDIEKKKKKKKTKEDLVLHKKPADAAAAAFVDTKEYFEESTDLQRWDLQGDSEQELNESTTSSERSRETQKEEPFILAKMNATDRDREHNENKPQPLISAATIEKEQLAQKQQKKTKKKNDKRVVQSKENAQRTTTTMTTREYIDEADDERDPLLGGNENSATEKINDDDDETSKTAQAKLLQKNNDSINEKKKKTLANRLGLQNPFNTAASVTTTTTTAIENAPQTKEAELAKDSRKSSRATASVSYSEPSLKVKMRRP